MTLIYIELQKKNICYFSGSMYDRWVMEQKDLKKIKRRELLELMLEQAKRIQELEFELKNVQDELDAKRIKINPQNMFFDFFIFLTSFLPI